MYMSGVAISGFYYALNNPMNIVREMSPRYPLVTDIMTG